MNRIFLVLALLLGSAGTLQAQPAARAGVAAAVRGSVLLDRGPEVGSRLESGDPIFLGDVIRTGDQGGLQVMLLDETVFTLGPQSQLVVDEFVYNPNEKGGRLDVRLAKGVFRFVTGKIARDTPENVELKLPVGSIGIRGTIGAARIDGDESVVALFGPGPLNEADARTGGLIVRGARGQRELLTPGWGVKVAAEGPPSAPFHVEPASFAGLGAHLHRTPGLRTPPPSKGTPERQAGALRRQGKQASEGAAQVAHIGKAVEDLDPSPLQNADEENFSNVVSGFGQFGLAQFPDGFTTLNQLVQHAGVSSETLIWGITGAPINPPHSGSFDASVVVDFGKQDVGFNFANLSSPNFFTFGTGSGFTKVTPFASGKNGLADFVVTGFYTELPSSACIPCTVTLNADFKNKFNLPARRGRLFIVITDGGTFATAGPFIGPPTLVIP